MSGSLAVGSYLAEKAAQAGSGDHDLLGAAGDVASIAAAILAAVAILGSVLSLWRRTLGRRRAMTCRVKRLGIGAQLSYFVAVLGEPPAIRQPMELDDHPWVTAQDPEGPDDEPAPRTGLAERLRRTLRPSEVSEDTPLGEIKLPQLDQVLWSFPDCWVQAFVDDTESILGFSVTQRSRRFKPTFSFPPNARRPRWWRVWGRHRDFEPFFSVRLGETRLAEVLPADADYPDRAPVASRIWTTVRPWFYADLHYLGNPGYYLCFVVASSWIGNPKHVGNVFETAEELGFPGWSPFASDGGETPEWSTLTRTHKFREQTTITTYGAMSDQYLAERVPWWGPHGDEVRLLLEER